MKVAHRAVWLLICIWTYPWAIFGLLLAGLVQLCAEKTLDVGPGNLPSALAAVPKPPWLPAAVVVIEGEAAAVMRRRGWGATTIGWVIFFWGTPTSPTLVRHELRHVKQGALLGPLFPLVYGALFLLGLLGAAVLEVAAPQAGGQPFVARVRHVCRAAYEDHPLERDARRAAEQLK